MTPPANQSSTPDARVVVAYFEPGEIGRYDAGRSLRAYQNSAKAIGVPLEVHRIPTPPKDKVASNPRWMMEVYHRNIAWRDIVHRADTPVVLTDADMLMLADPRDAFDGATWDVAVTVRFGMPPLNGGVLFAKPTRNARDFMDSWLETMDRMAEQFSEKQYAKWINLYASTDQAALAYLLMHTRETWVSTLPQDHYNAADHEWPRVCDDLSGVRLLHVKGRFREKCLGLPFKHRPSNDQVKAIEKLYPLWKRHDHD